MNAVRQRRLRSDCDAVKALAAASQGRLQLVGLTGEPPESYRLLFRCRSLTGLDNGVPRFGQEHHARITLPAAYPAAGPVATMLTPVLHPHIWPNRTVCLGAWSPQEKLSSVVLRIASMLVFEPSSMNWRSVADESVAEWARRERDRLPLDLPFAAAATVPAS